jgi:hypothetical protein
MTHKKLIDLHNKLIDLHFEVPKRHYLAPSYYYLLPNLNESTFSSTETTLAVDGWFEYNQKIFFEWVKEVRTKKS